MNNPVPNNEAEAVACMNAGGFMMNFKVEKIVEGNRVATATTELYPIGKTQSINLSLYTIFFEGDTVWPRVHAEGGTIHSADHHITYKKNGFVALYRISGTIGDVDINYVGLGDLSTHLPK